MYTLVDRSADRFQNVKRHQIFFALFFCNRRHELKDSPSVFKFTLGKKQLSRLSESEDDVHSEDLQKINEPTKCSHSDRSSRDDLPRGIVKLLSNNPNSSMDLV